MIINTDFYNESYIFETKPGLFSKDSVDRGSSFLLEKIKINPEDTVLDLGCGYGPIGIVTAKHFNPKMVYLVDTDIRAIKYCERNIELNNIHNAKAILSDGFENLGDTQFDVILSNPPTHLPKEIILEFINGSKKHLRLGGGIFLVTESRIKPFIKRELENIFGNYTEIAVKQGYCISYASK